MESQPGFDQEHKDNKKEFRDIVFEGQRLWRAAKKRPYTTFSQSIDLPEFLSGNLLNLVVEHLPEYIPPSVKQIILDTHPEPIVSAGMLIDNRVFTKSNLEPDIIVPEIVQTEEEKQHWQQGIMILTEIATDIASEDILKQIDSDKSKNRLSRYLLKGSRTIGGHVGYKKAYNNFVNALGGKERYDLLKQAFVLAMFSGDNDKINHELQKYGFTSLDHFAIEIGKQNNLPSDVNLALKFFGEKANRVTAEGIVSASFPGVINLALAHSSLSLSIGPLGTLLGADILNRIGSNAVGIALQLGIAGVTAYGLSLTSSFPHTVVHETVHYLSMDINHQGFIQIKQSN